MGTIARGIKSHGGTSFESDTPAIGSEVDTDFNTLYSEVNGQLDDANVDASADIALTKLGDFSADASTMSTVATPGTVGSESLATTLTGEISRLRYEIARLKFGNAEDQGGVLEWYERSINLLSNPNNVLPNSAFAAFQAPGSTTVPDSWSATGTAAAQYDHTTLSAGVLGLGHKLVITGHAATANTGILYTIPAASLRPSTTYLFYAMAWADSGDTARAFTTGAGTQLDVETTETTPDLLQGYFTTDATPTAVVLSLVSKAATDISHWFGAVVVPIITTPRTQGYTSVFQQLDTVAAAAINATGNIPALGSATAGTTFVNASGTALQRSITVPGHGYQLRVSSRAAFSIDGNAAEARIMLFESTDDGSNWALRDGNEVSVGTTAAAVGCTSNLFYTAAATPGTKYTFKVTGLVESAGATITPQGANGGVDQHGISFLCIELIPRGG